MTEVSLGCNKEELGFDVGMQKGYIAEGCEKRPLYPKGKNVRAGLPVLGYLHPYDTCLTTGM